jgi:hypothetical protein
LREAMDKAADLEVKLEAAKQGMQNR